MILRIKRRDVFAFRKFEEFRDFSGALIERQTNRDFSFVIEVASQINSKAIVSVVESLKNGKTAFEIRNNFFLAIFNFVETAGLPCVVITLITLKHENECVKFTICLLDKKRLEEIKPKIIKTMQTCDLSNIND